MLFPAVAIVRILGHQQAMPAKNGVACEKRADLIEELVAEDFPLDRQTSSSGIIVKDAVLAELLPEDLVFDTEVLDGSLVLPVDQPARRTRCV
jgi:hypothetical protein